MSERDKEGEGGREMDERENRERQRSIWTGERAIKLMRGG